MYRYIARCIYLYIDIDIHTYTSTVYMYIHDILVQSSKYVYSIYIYTYAYVHLPDTSSYSIALEPLCLSGPFPSDAEEPRVDVDARLGGHALSIIWEFPKIRDPIIDPIPWLKVGFLIQAVLKVLSTSSSFYITTTTVY